MNSEQMEAWCIEQLQNRRLNAALGMGDYVLTEDELLTVLRVAYKAGSVAGSGAMCRIVDEACAKVRIAQ